MKNTKALGILTVLSIPGLTFSQIVFNDTVFPDEFWSHGGSADRGAIVDAGTLPPGEIGSIISGGSVQATIISGGFGAPVTYNSLHVRNDLGYFPSSNGALSTITWNLWYETFIGGHVFDLLLFQGDSIYTASATEGASAELKRWQFHTRTVPVSDFFRISGSGASQLDFKASAAPILFGYRNYNNSGLRGSTNLGTNQPLNGGAFFVAQYEVKLNFEPVPEPGVFLGLLLPIGALITRRRKQPL